jgi:hypothetical protein
MSPSPNPEPSSFSKSDVTGSWNRPSKSRGVRWGKRRWSGLVVHVELEPEQRRDTAPPEDVALAGRAGDFLHPLLRDGQPVAGEERVVVLSPILEIAVVRVIEQRLVEEPVLEGEALRRLTRPHHVLPLAHGAGRRGGLGRRSSARELEHARPARRGQS